MSDQPAATAPGAPDAEGVAFDPVVHQAWKNGPLAGQARTDARGRWIMKSRVNIPAARARQAKAAKVPAKAPAVRPVAAPGRAPQVVPVATAGDILGGGALAGVMDEAPTPTEGTPPVDGSAAAPQGPDGPAPTASTIGPEPTAAPPPDEMRGTALMFAGLAELVGKVTFDAEEWELDAPRRDALAGAIEDKLRADGGPNLTPGQRLAACAVAVFGPNLAKPKTRATVGGWGARLFGKKKGPDDDAAKT